MVTVYSMNSDVGVSLWVYYCGYLLKKVLSPCIHVLGIVYAVLLCVYVL